MINKDKIFSPPSMGDSVYVFRESTIEPEEYQSRFCVSYIQNGKVDALINHRRISISSGDLIMVLPESNVSSSSRGKISGVSTTFSKLDSILPNNIISFDGPLVSKALVEVYMSNRTISHSTLKQYLDSLIDKPEYNSDEAFATISELLRKDIAYYYDRLSLINRKRITTRLDILHRVEAIKQYLEENYTSKFSLEKISRCFCMSKFALIRNFKEVFNTTPHQYFVEQRMKMATNLLKQGLSVKETSQRCGYPDIFSFSKQFRTVKGFPPGRMRSIEETSLEKFVNFCE